MNSETKIFGLGLSKTGTSSLGEALNRLGIKTIHYPFDDATYTELRSGNYNLSILQHYQGIVDIPVAPYYAQLDKAFPGSKFILTVRDVESWLRSAEKHWELLMQWWQIDPAFQKFQAFISAAVYGSIAFNADRFRFVYEQHCKNVQDYFGDREDFLVMDICGGEGWERLCAFLDCAVPDEPFPHANEWMHKLMEATADVQSVIPPGETFVLIDQEGFGAGFSEGRKKIAFLQKDGRYNGLPADDSEALAAFAEVKEQSPAYLVIGWPSFWWLKHYQGFAQHLQQYPCVLNNDRLIVYRLSRSADAIIA